MIATLLEAGAGFRMQVTNTACPKTADLNTAYSSYSVIPMGQADVRIRDGETLVIASPNMATGETNRMVAFFTPTVFTPPEIPVHSDDKLPNPRSIPSQPQTSTPSL